MSLFNTRINLAFKSKPIKAIVFLTIIISLFSALCDALFPYFFGIPGPQLWFSLSLWGLKHYFFWQVLTYMFTSPVAGGLSFSFFLYLTLNMYFLWIVGSSVSQIKGPKHFLTLYLGGGILAGIVAACILYFSLLPIPFAGPNPALYCLLTAWMMLIPEVEVLLFFTFPLRVKWLIVGILGINLLVDLSHGNFLNFFIYLTSIGFGYLYSLIVWKQNSPFKLLHKLETLIINFSNHIEKRFFSSCAYESHYAKDSKIYDFKTGKIILNDEDFMDACLSKIALKGKKSLTLLEKLRMSKISRKRKKKSKTH